MTPQRAQGRSLVLGSAQFGLAYGVTNRLGVPDDAELGAILQLAGDSGIGWIDTARSYGNAEQRLGAFGVPKSHRIITKIEPLDTLMAEANLNDAARRIEISLTRSFNALETTFIDVVLLHRPEDAARPGVLETLLAARQNGRIGAIGVSVYTPDEALEWLSERAITHIQLPCNPLDSRWRHTAFLAARQARRDVTIHARSVFLQGLLLAPPDRWPAWVSNAGEVVALLKEAAVTLPGGRLELCLRYHRSFDWIDASVVGVTSRAELHDIVSAAVEEALPLEAMALIGHAATRTPLPPP